jgi:DNA-binding transcriptional LysR family regulator
MSFGILHLGPALAEFARAYPRVTLDLRLDDRFVNLVEEGVDVAVRIGTLTDSTLVARKLSSTRVLVCASPAYLAEHGVPREPEELREHVLVSSSGISPRPEWRFTRDGEPIAMRVEPRLTVTTNDAAVEAAVRGLGIARLLSYQVAPHLADGSLQIVLADREIPALPIHVVHREGRHSAAKVRSFVDMIVERLRAQASLN